MNTLQVSFVKRTRGIAMIGSPLLFMLSEIFHPVTQTEAAKELSSVASHFTQWYIAHLLALGAIILLPYAVQGLLSLLDGSCYILSHVAAGLSSIGVVAISGLLAFDLVTWQMAAGGSREEMVRLYEQVTGSLGFSLPFLTAGPLTLVLGILLFSILLFRSRVIKRWQSVFLGTGIFLYGFAGPVFPVSNATLIVISGAALMLLGLGTVGFDTILAKSPRALM